eukprot:3702160-Amphidinium_carterae.1
MTVRLCWFLLSTGPVKRVTSPHPLFGRQLYHRLKAAAVLLHFTLVHLAIPQRRTLRMEGLRFRWFKLSPAPR